MAVPGGSVSGGSIAGQIILTDQTQAAVDSAIARAATLDKKFQDLQNTVTKGGASLGSFGTQGEQAAARLASSGAVAARGIGLIQVELTKAEQEVRNLKREVQNFDDTVGPGFKAATGAMLDEAIAKTERLKAEFREAKKEFTSAPSGGANFLKNLTGQLDSFAGSAKNVGMQATVGITLPLLAAGGAAVKLGMDAIESENLVAVSFGNMKQSADDWSKGLQKSLGLNEYEVRKQAGTLFNMTTGMGIARDKAFDLSTGMTKLAYDMASFRNINVEDAFIKLRSGLTGETEPLKAIGILVDEATVKQEAYRTGIAHVGAELTQQQKIMARWSAILRQTGNDQGDLARTLDSPSNMLRVLGQRVENVAISFGMALMPVVEKVIHLMQGGVGVLEKAVNLFTALPQPVQLIVLALGGIAAVAGPALMFIGQIASGISGAIKLYTALAGAQTMAATSAASAAASTTATVAAAEAASGGLIATIIGGFEAAGAAVAGFLTWPVLLVAGITAAVGAILYHFGLLGPIKDFFVDLGTVAVGFAKQLAGQVYDAVKSFGSSVLEGAESLGKMIYKIDAWALSLVGIDLDAVVEKVKNFATQSYEWVSTKLDQAYEKAKSWARSVRDVVHETAEAFRESVPDVKPTSGFKSVADQAADLRLKMIPLPEVATDAASGFQKLTDRLRDAANELKNLKSIDKKQLGDLLKAGVDPSIIQKSTGLSSMAIDLFQKQEQAATKAAKASDTVAKANDKIAHSMYDLTGAQVEAIKYYQLENLSVEQIAQKLEIYPLQVKQAIDADKERIEFGKKSVKQQEELLKAPGQALLDNLKVQNSAQDAYWKFVNETTLVGVDKELAEIDRWVAGEKAKLDQRASNYEASIRDIEKLANAKRVEAKTQGEIKTGPFAHVFGPEMPPEVAQRIAKRFTSQFREVISTDVPQILMSAFEGGGGIWGAIDSLAIKIGARFKESDMFKGFASSVSSKMGSMFSFGSSTLAKGLTNIFSGGISAAIDIGMQLLAKGVKKLFGGPSEDELKGRDASRKFEDSIIGTLTAQQKAEAGSDRWKQVVIGVRDAYRDVGKSAAEAEAIVQKLWQAEKEGPEAVKKVQDEIEASIDKAKKLREGASKFGMSQSELDQAAADAKEVYEYMAKSGQYSAKQIEDAFKSAQEAADRAAGIDVDAQKKAEEATKSALDELIAQRDELLKGIAQEAPEENMGVIEKQMREQAAALEASIKAQQEATTAAATAATDALDKAMERNTGVVGPRAETQLQQVVANNEQAQATMDQAIDQHLSKQTDAVMSATDKQALYIKQTLESIKIDPIHVEVKLDFPATGIVLPGGVAGGEKKNWKDGEIGSQIADDRFKNDWDAGYGEAQPASSGALVTPAGLSYYARGGRVRWRKQGTDDIPAMLTAGERVLSVDQNKAFEAGVRMAKNSPASGSDEIPPIHLYNTITLDGHVVTTQVIKNIKHDKRAAKQDLRDAIGMK